jgi:hypothetical protein
MPESEPLTIDTATGAPPVSPQGDRERPGITPTPSPERPYEAAISPDEAERLADLGLATIADDGTVTITAAKHIIPGATQNPT